MKHKPDGAVPLGASAGFVSQDNPTAPLQKNESQGWLLFGSAQWSLPFILSLLSAVALPVLFNPWSYNAFALPKALLLRLVLLLLAGAVLLQLTSTRPSSPASPPPGSMQRILWAALALGGTLLLATLFSVNPPLSWWGSYQRQEGLLTWAAYLTLFGVTTLSLTARWQLTWVWRALVWGSGPVVGYGLLQGLGLDPFVWQTDAVSPLLSSLGRANFLGSYVVLVLPLTLGRLAVSARRWPYLALLTAQFSCLLLTQARGAWLGLAAAMVVLGLGWAVAGRRRWLGLTTLLLAGVVVSLLLVLNTSPAPVDALAQVPGLERLARLSDTSTGSTAARLTIWRTTLALIAARPWFGYGPETMQPVFERVFPPQLVYYQGRHVVVDRAHNLWLDLAMSAGLVGVLALAWLLGSLGRLAWHGLWNAPDRGSQALWAGLSAGLVGHLADLQVSFESVGTAPIFWLMLTLVAALHRIETTPNPPDLRSCRAVDLLRLRCVPVLLGLVAIVGLVCGRPLLADQAYYQAQTAPAVREQMAAARRAVRLWPLTAEYRLGLARLAGQAGHLTQAEQQLTAATRLLPRHAQVWAAGGDLYARQEAFDSAEMAYRRAVSLAPTIATYHTALGLVLARQGQLEAGAIEIERAVALDTTDFVAYRHLAALYRALGRHPAAAWAEQEAAYWADKSN